MSGTEIAYGGARGFWMGPRTPQRSGPYLPTSLLCDVRYWSVLYCDSVEAMDSLGTEIAYQLLTLS
eukprot:2357328-Rhodomonas_salina.1